MRRSSFLLTAALVVAILAPLTMAYRISGAAHATGGGGRILGYVGVAVLLVALLAATAVGLRDLSRSLAGVDPAASAIAARLGEKPEQQLLVARWLARSRWYRNVGGVAGVLGGLFGGFGAMVLVGLIGLTFGSLAAELHLLRPDRISGTRPAGPRVAGLERRSLRRYWEPARQLALAAAGVVAVWLLLADRFGLVDDLRVSWVVGVVLIVASALFLQWRVATRPRPALPGALRSADDLIRSLAITHGIANPAITLALAFLGQGLSDTSDALSVMAWLTALALYWRFRRLGLDHLLDEPPLAARMAAA